MSTAVAERSFDRAVAEQQRRRIAGARRLNQALAGPEPTPTWPVLGRREERNLCHILGAARLDSQERLVYLSYAKGWREERIARQLGRPPGMVRALLVRACEKLEPYRSPLFDDVLLPAAYALAFSVSLSGRRRGAGVGLVDDRFREVRLAARDTEAAAVVLAEGWLEWLFAPLAAVLSAKRKQ